MFGWLSEASYARFAFEAGARSRSGVVAEERGRQHLDRDARPGKRSLGAVPPMPPVPQQVNRGSVHGTVATGRHSAAAGPRAHSTRGDSQRKSPDKRHPTCRAWRSDSTSPHPVVCASALRRNVARSASGPLQGRMVEGLDTLPTFGMRARSISHRQGPPQRADVSSRRSHALASFQSRITVSTDTSNTSPSLLR